MAAGFEPLRGAVTFGALLAEAPALGAAALALTTTTDGSALVLALAGGTDDTLLAALGEAGVASPFPRPFNAIIPAPTPTITSAPTPAITHAREDRAGGATTIGAATAAVVFPGEAPGAALSTDAPGRTSVAGPDATATGRTKVDGNGAGALTVATLGVAAPTVATRNGSNAARSSITV